MTVITTVGTSVFSNGIRGEKIDANRVNETLTKNTSYYTCFDDDFYKGEMKTLKNETILFFQAKNYSIDISAEIKSLVLIQAQENCKLEVYLICTDTILSVVAADMIKEYFRKIDANEEKFVIRFEHDEEFIIRDLAVDDFQKFDTEGVNNLINSIYNFLKEDLYLRQMLRVLDRITVDDYYENKSKEIKNYVKDDLPKIHESLKNNKTYKLIITQEGAKKTSDWATYAQNSNLIQELKSQQIYLNISGGFKAMIPYTSLMGQLYDLRLTYVFDDEKSEMIFIDKMPINFDLSLAEQYAPYLERLESFGEETEIFKLFQKQKLVRTKNGKTELTAIGTLLKEFIMLNASTDSRSWGIFAEYKIFEYFYENPYKQNSTIKHSKYIGNGKEEIDIEIMSGNELFAFEIKSFFQPANTIDKIINSANNRIDLYNQLFPNQLKEYNLVIYKTQFDDLNLLGENLKNLRDACKEKNVVCKAFYVQIQLDEKGNAYQRFMQKSMTKDKLIEILIQP